jgi:hypothetical protein
MTTKCLQDSDCDYLNICNSENLCTHKEVFPAEPIEIAGYCIISILIGLSNVAGLGAGIVKVAILMLMINYNMAESTAASYPFLLGSAISNNLILIFLKHPTYP